MFKRHRFPVESFEPGEGFGSQLNEGLIVKCDFVICECFWDGKKRRSANRIE